MDSQESGLVSKMLIIMLNFRVGTSKTKNTDHKVIMSIQVTYETDHISLLCHSTMSIVFYEFYCGVKEKERRRIINSKKKKYLYRKLLLLLF